MVLQDLMFFAGFMACCGLIFFDFLLLLLFGMWRGPLYHHILEVCGLFLILKRLICSEIVLSLRRDVGSYAFEQRWDSQRLWGLLERVQVHFVLWNINETLGVRGGMLWFKVMCLGVKLIGGEIVVVHIDCQLDKNLEPHGRQTSVWLEHGWKNDVWWTMPWGTMREALGKKAEGLFCQVNFVPRIVLGYDFMSPVTYIYI